MRTLHYAIIGGLLGPLVYLGVTGKLSIPDLPFELPFTRHVQPTPDMLTAPIIYPLMTGPAGFTADLLVKRFEGNETKVRWELASDKSSWIMRYSGRFDLTGNDFVGAVLFTYLPDASQAGVTGPGFLVSGWAEDGQELSSFEIINMLAYMDSTL